MSLSMRKLGREIRRRTKDIMKNKKYVRQYWLSIRQKVKWQHVVGGAAVLTGVVASFFGVRHWRHRNDLPLSSNERKELMKRPKITVKTKGHHRLAFLVDSLAVLSSVVSLLGITKSTFKK